MAEKMYAWSVFVADRNEFGQTTKTINPGDEVTREKLKMSEDDWDYLVETGAVRPLPYPDVPDGTAPAEHFARQDAEFSRGELSDDEAKEVLARREALITDEEKATAAASSGEVPKASSASTSK